MMRAESLASPSRGLSVPAHRLLDWRDRVLITSEGALKKGERDVRDEDIERLGRSPT